MKITLDRCNNDVQAILPLNNNQLLAKSCVLGDTRVIKSTNAPKKCSKPIAIGRFQSMELIYVTARYL